MNAVEFIEAWDAVVRRERAKAVETGVPEVADDLQRIVAPPAVLEAGSFPATAGHFLHEAGLPRSCAPFLSFQAVVKSPSSLVQHYGLDTLSPSGVSRAASFFVIGSDGAGNPLCLDSTCEGEVVMLDHEDRFRTRTFVASSVQKLAQALLILHTAPHADFIKHLQPIDPRAADESAFLPKEVRQLLE